MNTSKWQCSNEIETLDWGEGDAIVYRKDCGDVHVVAGTAKSIVQALKTKPMSNLDLRHYVNSGGHTRIDLDAINRQISQLSSLGVIDETK